MENHALLHSYLRQPGIPTFQENYAAFASNAVQSNKGHIRYLLALAEEEEAQREQNKRAWLIKAARFPIQKE